MNATSDDTSGGRSRLRGQLLLLRGRAGLTQRALAALLGISEKAVQKWEAGEGYPGAARLQALIALYVARQVFPAGREAEEARALWELLRRAGGQRTPPFDEAWFATLHPAAPAAGLWEPRDYSDETARRIDAAIQRLLTEARQGTRALLAENRATLDAIAAALLREESLDREDLAALVSSRDAPVWERGPVTSAPRRGGQRRRCAVCGGSGCVAGVTLM